MLELPSNTRKDGLTLQPVSLDIWLGAPVVFLELNFAEIIPETLRIDHPLVERLEKSVFEE